MTASIHKFPKKYDIANVKDFIEGYGKVLEDMDPSELPTNIIVLELFKDGEDVAHNTWCGGPTINTVEFAGLLEVVKQNLIMNNYFNEESDD